MNPEKAAMRNIDSQTRMDNIKETAQLLLPLHPQISTQMESIAINPENFASLYDVTTIEKDARYVRNRKEDFAREDHEAGPNGLTKGETRKLAEILEYQIIKGINIGRWLPFCTATKTSEYDDIANGMDMVVAFEKGTQSSHLGMGVDISFSHNLQAKFQRIKDEIDAYDGEKNRLGVVKYFRSKQTGFRGELSSLPRVVIALDLGVMEDLARVKKGGSGHIAQHTVIREIEHQLAVFADYAINNNSDCADKIMQAQTFVHTISQHLKSEQRVEDSEYSKNNQMDAAIERGLSLFR